MENNRFLVWLVLGSAVALVAGAIIVFFVQRAQNNRDGFAEDDLGRCMRRDLTTDEDCADQVFFTYFLRDAKTLQDMGLPVYWLGREFTATPNGIVFRGPYGVEFGGEVEGGGAFMRYVSKGPDPGLEITVYRADAWKLVEDRIENPRLLSNEGQVTRRTVTVKGREAELLSVPSATRPVNAITLVLELDRVVVVAVAGSGGPGPGGVDYSLFIRNPDLLVQVMQDLRPYPE